MNRRYSLLGHVVPSMTLQVENAATEALSYILREYEKAREAFVSLVSSIGSVGEDDLTFGTQVRMWGGGIPDLVGADSSEAEVLLVESKFWAPLTPHQPTGYLSRLPSKKEGLVLFIAPVARHRTLWQELTNRCRAAGLKLDDEMGDTSGWRAARTSELHRLAYASWPYVLDHLEGELEDAGEVRGAHEVWQLRGLCERLAKNHTLPSDHREQLRRIVDTVAKRLVESGIFRTKGYRATPGPTSYRRYGTMRDRINWFVEYDMQRATDLGESQLWVGGPLEEEMIRELSPDVEENPPRFYRQGRKVVFPLDLPTEVDPGVIIASLTAQVENIVEILWKRDDP